MAELSARYDGHDMFSGMSSDRWGLFPALSLGWRIGQEKFIKDNTSIFDDLKLRFGVGKTGVANNIQRYTFLQALAVHTTPSLLLGDKSLTSHNGYYTMAPPNYNLTWEKHQQYNFGVDATLWRGLLEVEFDVFYKYVYDIIANLGGDYPPSVGGYFPSIGNVDKQDYKGFEISLTHNNKIGDFNYSVGLVGSYTKSRWLKSSNDSPNTPDWYKLTGKEVGAKVGFIAEGLYKDQADIDNSPRVPGYNVRVGDIKYRDINGDGVVSYEQDMGYIGKSSTPRFVGGLNLRGEWKGFDLYVRFQTGLGRDVAISGLYGSGVHDQTSLSKPFYNGGNSPTYLVERSWTPENPDGEFPRLSVVPAIANNAFSSSFWIRNGNYLRMKELEFGYSLPKELVAKFAAQNLFTLSGLSKYNIDPESPNVQNGYYPQQRLLSGGVKLTF